MRLLKLYESGLPSWAVLLPSYGVWYRPWLRTVSWLLFILISIISMACGFYDLYKNVPYLKVVVSAVAARLYLPPSGLLAWLERSTSIRLSILLTYLFSKSPLFLGCIKTLRTSGAFVAEAFRPLTQTLSLLLGSLSASVLFPLLSLGRAIGGSMAALLAPLFVTVMMLIQPLVSVIVVLLGSLTQGAALLFGPLSSAVWLCVSSATSAVLFLYTTLRDMGSTLGVVLHLLLSGPWAFVVFVRQAAGLAVGELHEMLPAVAAVTRAVSSVVGTAAKTARSAMPVVGAASRATAAAVQATANVGKSQDSILAWVWLITELQFAYNSLRTTLLNVINSAKTIINGFVMFCCMANRHRVSLLLQLRHFSVHQHTRLLTSFGLAADEPQDVDDRALFDSPSTELLLEAGGSNPNSHTSRRSVSADRSSPSKPQRRSAASSRGSIEVTLGGQLGHFFPGSGGNLLAKSVGGALVMEDELYPGLDLECVERGAMGRHRSQPYSAAGAGYDATEMFDFYGERRHQDYTLSSEAEDSEGGEQEEESGQYPHSRWPVLDESAGDFCTVEQQQEDQRRTAVGKMRRREVSGHVRPGHWPGQQPAQGSDQEQEVRAPLRGAKSLPA